MTKLRYPIGIQTFSKIITEGYAYVDKTQYIKPLIDQGHFIFLSRPRRFGKSLMLSTIHAYFEGRRKLFKGLEADKMGLDWTPSPHWSRSTPATMRDVSHLTQDKSISSARTSMRKRRSADFNLKSRFCLNNILSARLNFRGRGMFMKYI